MRFFFTGPRVMGIRPGISFGARELFGSAATKQKKPGEPMTGSFVYVIRGDHNLVKIGVSTNPNARLAQLRTASAFPIDFSYLAVTPGTGFDIEQAAHAMLASHRCNGEWFDVQPEIAVAAIAGAAHKLGQPLLPVTADVAAQILQIAADGGAAAGSGPDTKAAKRWGLLAYLPGPVRWLIAIALAVIAIPVGIFVGFFIDILMKQQ